MHHNSEKMIREVLFKNALKIHKFEIDDNGEIIKGDVKALKQDLSDYKITVEDQGIGSYEYWGSRGEDTNLVLDIEDGCAELSVDAPKGTKIKNIVEILTEDIDTVIDSDNRKVTGRFVLKVKNHRIKNTMHEFTLCYELDRR